MVIESDLVAKLVSFASAVSTEDRQRFELLSRDEMTRYPPLFRELAVALGPAWFWRPRARQIAGRGTYDEYAAALTGRGVPIHPSLETGRVVFTLEDGDYEVLAADGRVLRFDGHDETAQIVVAASFEELVRLLIAEHEARHDDEAWLAKGASQRGLRLARGTEALAEGPDAGRGTMDARPIGTARLLDAVVERGRGVWKVVTSATVLRGDLVVADYDPSGGRGRSMGERLSRYLEQIALSGTETAWRSYAAAEHVVCEVEESATEVAAIERSIALRLRDAPEPPPAGTVFDIVRSRR